MAQEEAAEENTNLPEPEGQESHQRAVPAAGQNQVRGHTKYLCVGLHGDGTGMQRWWCWVCLWCWLCSGCSGSLGSSLAGPPSSAVMVEQGPPSLSLSPPLTTSLSLSLSLSYFSDSSTAMFIVFLLFVIPSRPPWGTGLSCRESESDQSAYCGAGCCDGSAGGALLDWNTVQSKLAWNVVILLGAGLALSAGAKVR